MKTAVIGLFNQNPITDNRIQCISQPENPSAITTRTADHPGTAGMAMITFQQFNAGDAIVYLNYLANFEILFQSDLIGFTDNHDTFCRTFFSRKHQLFGIFCMINHRQVIGYRKPDTIHCFFTDFTTNTGS